MASVAFFSKFSRQFCTKPTISINSISSSLQKDAKYVANLIDQAREATIVASEDNSDDDERRLALSKVKTALFHYVQLVSRGDPPIQLKQNASPLSPDDPVLENDITRLLGPQVSQMKQELFKSNRQRVWIGWSGWF